MIIRTRAWDGGKAACWLFLLSVLTMMAMASSMPSGSSSAVVLMEESLNTTTASAESDYESEFRSLLPMTGRDVATIVLATIGLLVAAGGGIGGGGILVPLFILVLGMDAKNAIPLSNVTILGGAIANTFLAARSRHPYLDRPLVDWSIVLMMEPSTIIGAVVGSFANKLLPSLVISVMLVVVLSLMAHRTLKRGLQCYRSETAMKKLEGDMTVSLLSEQDSSTSLESQETDSSTDSLQPSEPPPHHHFCGGEEAKLAPQGTPAAMAIAEEERFTPLWKPLTLVMCFLGVVAIDVLKGGEGKSLLGFSCGSPLYWTTTLAVIPWVAIFFFFYRRQLLSNYQRKLDAGYRFDDHDIHWSSSNTIKYPMICATAGLFAGIFGVGGGIVKGPLMLEMGVLPAVTAASAATMILFTSASATATFYLFGMLQMDYAIFFFVWGFGSTLVGKKIVDHLVKKYQKASLVILSIGAVIFLSAILMAYESVMDIIQNPENAFRMSSLCNTPN